MDEWADYEPEVIELKSSSTSGSTIWTRTTCWSARTGTPDLEGQELEPIELAKALVELDA